MLLKLSSLLVPLSLFCFTPSLQDNRIPSQCGLNCGEYTLTNGSSLTFSNLNYPNQDTTASGSRCICNWLIHAEPGQNVLINFATGHFRVDTFITVVDYGQGADKVMAICGNNDDYSSRVSACNGLISSRGSLLVQLDTDPDDLFVYSFTVSSTTQSPTTGITPMPNKPHSLDCTCNNGLIEVNPGSSVSLKSPNYPGDYADYCYCLWTLVAPPGYRIRANLGYIHTEQLWDYVVFYNRHENGTDNSSAVAYSQTYWCSGDTPYGGNIVSDSNTAVFTFVSDRSNVEGGFSTTITAVNCSNTDCTSDPVCPLDKPTSPSTSTPMRTTKLTTTTTATTSTTTTPTTTLAPTGFQDCQEIYHAGYSVNGIHTITVAGHTFRVICQLIRNELTGVTKAWTLIQRQSDGKTEFNRNFADYQTGFGTLGGSFWLGLDKLFWMTTAKVYSLRIDLRDVCGSENNAGWESYGLFSVGSPASNYTLGLGGDIQGPLGDSMKMFTPSQNFAKFSTADADNDASPNNCAQMYGGGWWFSSCGGANLNGRQYPSCASASDAAFWESWVHSSRLKPSFTQMAIAPLKP